MRKMCLFMVLTMLVGCTGCESSLDIEKKSTNEDKVTMLTFYNADETKDIPWNDPVAKKITEKTGVKLKIERPVDIEKQQISLMIASGDYPDLIFAKDDSDKVIESGMLIDMSDLIEEYGPNIKKMYSKYYNRLKYNAEDDSIYQLCSKGVDNQKFKTSGNAMLQFAVMEENDYEIPRTLDEYEKYIKDYMVKYPTINGEKTIGLSLCCSDWHWYITLANPSGFIANGAADNGQWIVEDKNNYNCMYKHTAPNQKEYFKWLNKMYNEGILDSEFATQTFDDYVAKIASGRVLGLMDQDYDLYDAIAVLNKNEMYDRTYAPLPVTMDENTKCVSLMDQGLEVGWGVGITTACKDKVKAIKFLDYLCSDEGQVLTHWGIEGKNYYINKDGKRCRTYEEIKNNKENADYDKETGVSLYIYPFPCYGDGVIDSTGNSYTMNTKESVRESYNVAEKKCAEAWNVDLLTEIFPQPNTFETMKYTPVWSQNLTQEFNDIATKLDEISKKWLIKCIICKEEEFDARWDIFQKELKTANVEKGNEILTDLVRKNVEFLGIE